MGAALFSPVLRQGLQRIFPYLLALVFGLAITLTGSRTPLVVVGLHSIYRLCQQISWSKPLAVSLTVLAFTALSTFFYFVIVNIDFIALRGTDLFSFSNLSLIQTVWDNISIDYSPIDNEVVEFNEFDLSWWLRIHKWMYVVKIFCFYPQCWLQGIGPGFAFSALDGGLLRVVVEYGLVGSFLFWKLFRSIYQVNPQLKWMVIALAINMITLDAQMAYKPMSLLLFVAGALSWQSQSFAQRLHRPQDEVMQGI